MKEIILFYTICRRRRGWSAGRLSVRAADVRRTSNRTISMGLDSALFPFREKTEGLLLLVLFTALCFRCRLRRRKRNECAATI